MENADRNVDDNPYSVRFAYMSHEGEFRETVTFWLLTFLLGGTGDIVSVVTL